MFSINSLWARAGYLPPYFMKQVQEPDRSSKSGYPREWVLVLRAKIKFQQNIFDAEDSNGVDDLWPELTSPREGI